MNRPVPQSLRGIPAGFGGQQQQQQQQQPPQQQPPQQQGRTVSNRIPNGKLANNGTSWAFGGGVPMGSAGLQNSSRQLGGNLSFAQSLSGSQPATPLDLSEFPSLSNNAQLPNAAQSSMWSGAGARNLGGPVQRNQSTPLSAQQTQQDDLFGSSSRLTSSQGTFRYGNQGHANLGNASQPSQPQPSSIDEFPPLSGGFRNANGDIGQERGSSLLSTAGFGTQTSGNGATSQTNRAGNGLLNALSANTRSSEAQSPDVASSQAQLRDQEARGADVIGASRQKTDREESLASQSSALGGTLQAPEAHPSLGAIGNDAPTNKKTVQINGQTFEENDPLAGMADIDKFGLKGLRTLMNNYPDYNTCITGVDPMTFGLNLQSPDMISTQIYSLFSDSPPRPAVPKFRLPDCYSVNNVQPIENKIPSFNEETLMWIFYSCPGDVKQHLAAAELNTRNWRWHKKLQIWLTKDELMAPRVLSAHHEQGYYIIWDTVNWRKERRELLLQYADLETISNGGPAPSGYGA